MKQYFRSIFLQIVVDCPSTGCQQVFLCQRWIADDEGDGRLERDLYESEDMRRKRRPSTLMFSVSYDNVRVSDKYR